MFPRSYTAVLAELKRRLKEPAPGRVQILCGPRQVGKTTLLLEIAAEWGDRALYATADAPEAALTGWWEQQWQNVERLAAAPAAPTKPAVLLLDEIQYHPNWSRLLKNKADQLRRNKTALHVVVAGSSALQVGAGARETMAGRFERLELSHWPASELAAHFKLDRQKKLDAGNRARAGAWIETLVRYGSYPGAVGLLGDPARWRAYVRDSIVEPAIGRDVLAIEAIRKPALLRQVFAVCAGHPAEVVSLQKICGQLSDKGAIETVAHYLHVLEQAYLVAAVPKFARKAVRQRASPPKLVVLNQAILSAVAGGDPPSSDSDPEKWGRYVENACIAHAWNCGQRPCYWRAEPLEVDFILDGDWGRWTVEVKTGRYQTRDLAGLFEFCRRNPGWRPLILCNRGDEAIAKFAGVDAVSWQDFLLKGLERR